MSKFTKKYIISSVAVAALFAAMPSFSKSGVTLISNAMAAENYMKFSRSAIGHKKTIRLGLNKSIVIDLPGKAHDILVANPDVADAITRTSSRIYVFGKQIGETNLFIFDNQGRQMLDLEISIERDVAGLEKHIEKYVPGSNVKVEMMNDNVILTGTVPTPLAATKAVQLAQIFVKGGEATTNAFSNPSSTSSGDGASIVFDDDEPRQSSQIVNLLRIEGEDQVHLKVTVAEIQRTIVKQLGVDMLANNGTNFSVITDNPFGLGNQIGQGSALINSTSGEDRVQAMIRAMDQAGVMRTLAEPTLTAISGETASFMVGGEYQVPNGASENDGSVTYSYRTVEYGVSLAFTPIVLSPGRISMRIKTEVSEPTFDGSGNTPRGSNIAGSTIPGVRRRQAETSVELPSGGSMVIAGLLRDDVRQVSSGYPGLKNIPILGTLFRSRDYQRSETELVIIATPYLVRPIARQNLARPDDNYAAAADGAANFLGRVNRMYGKVEGSVPEGRYHGNPGFIYK